MKVVTTAIATLALLGSFSLANAQGMSETRTKVVVHKEAHRGPAVKKVVIRHDRGLHRGWSHSEHRGAVMKKKVVIERKQETTVHFTVSSSVITGVSDVANPML